MRKEKSAPFITRPDEIFPGGDGLTDEVSYVEIEENGVFQGRVRRLNFEDGENTTAQVEIDRRARTANISYDGSAGGGGGGSPADSDPLSVAKTAGIGADTDHYALDDHQHAMGILTAKGDLLTHDGTTAERLAVGSNGKVLVADSGEATGLKWSSAYRGVMIALCTAFTPAGTGADAAEVPVPYDPTDGTTIVTWNVRRITLRVQTAGGTPGMMVQKSTAAGAFSATTVGAVALGSGAYEGSNTTALGTIQSGNKLRFHVDSLGSGAANWTVTVELGL